MQENIKIFLEITPSLKNRVQKFKNRGFNNKHIQMILMDENLYDKV